jgi:hypothetical protein
VLAPSSNAHGIATDAKSICWASGDKVMKLAK